MLFKAGTEPSKLDLGSERTSIKCIDWSKHRNWKIKWD